MDTDVDMAGAPDFPDDVLKMFTTVGNDPPSTSSLSPTLSMLQQADITPGLTRSRSPGMGANEFLTNLDEIAGQLASRMGDIDIESIASGSDVAKGKGKEVATPGGSSQAVSFA